MGKDPLEMLACPAWGQNLCSGPGQQKLRPLMPGASIGSQGDATYSAFIFYLLYFYLLILDAAYFLSYLGLMSG